MLTPAEYKTVQAQILEYTGNNDWSIVSHEEAKWRLWFNPNASFKDRAKYLSILFDLFDTKLQNFIPRCVESKDAFLNQFHHFHTHRIPCAGK